jgi:hypothetical protein
MSDLTQTDLLIGVIGAGHLGAILLLIAVTLGNRNWPKLAISFGIGIIATPILLVVVLGSVGFVIALGAFLFQSYYGGVLAVSMGGPVLAFVLPVSSYYLVEKLEQNGIDPPTWLVIVVIAPCSLFVAPIVMVYSSITGLGTWILRDIMGFELDTSPETTTPA